MTDTPTPAARTIDELATALKAAMDFIDASPCDPDITEKQIAAWMKLKELKPRELLANLPATETTP